MQNWNQWQLSAGAVTTPMPQPPVGYATSGTDPMAMMQAYMQYYNQPAPSGYTAEQWAAAQQQNWAQWQQWQQQYQQWQAQYGEKYEETMKQLSVQNVGLASQAAPLANVQHPPLPKEDAKPPLPPNTLNMYQFTSMPPPNQNNLPLFPAKQAASSTVPANIPNSALNPPLPSSQPPLPAESSSSSSSSSNIETNLATKRAAVSEPSSAKKLKLEDDELTEAEKTFDAQFKEWEEQFNKWKQQNANHPDKTQYKQYEAKWTSWREKLIERREQMRKKREQQKQPVKAEPEKSKSLPGDDKIMNILSNTENQGLINNLLGIGKTLGLTISTSVPPPPPPPPPTESTSSNVQTTVTSSSCQGSAQTTSTQATCGNTTSNVNQSSWSSQQWPSQYNAGMNASNIPDFQSGVPPPLFGTTPPQLPPVNFTQPPPNFPAGVPNFSQPPPGFPSSDSRQSQSHVKGRSSFGSNDGAGSDTNSAGSNVGQPNNFSINDHNRQKDMGLNSDRFSRDTTNKNMSDQQGNQFRSNEPFGGWSPNLKLNDDREMSQFRRDDRNFQDHGSTTFNSQKVNFDSSNDRWNNDRFGSGGDRFGSGNNRFVPGNDRFPPPSDRPESNDRFGANNDRFNRNSFDRFDPKESADNRRDSFSNNARNFNRNNQFEPPNNLPPELRKLMQKRKAAMDVFKPSFLDSDKTSSVGSLSESFKKIAGDSPFAIKSSNDFAQRSNNSFAPRGSNFSPSGPGSFRMPGNEFRPRDAGDFASPRPSGLGPRNSFDLKDGPASGLRETVDNFGRESIDHANFDPRAGNDFERRSNSTPYVPDFINTITKSDPAPLNKNNRLAENIPEMTGDNKVIEEISVSLPKPIKCDQEVQDDNKPKDEAKNYPASTDSIPLLDNPPWTLKNDKDTENVLKSSGLFSGQDTQNSGTEKGDNSEVGDQKILSNISEDGSIKKSDVLPFMGENDPKPEDLNMEPPPELPNLGQILTDNVQETDESMKRVSEPFDSKTNADISFGPREMQFKPNMPPQFGPRGPTPGGRFNSFEPRGPFPFSPSGPSQHQFGPRGPHEGQFAPRTPNEGPFGPRGPNNVHFPPRGPNDTQFVPRGPGNAQFGPRGPTDVQFGPRGPNDAQFGLRGPNDAQFGPRAPNDAKFGPRGPNDAQFGPRGPNDAQFQPQGSNNRPFGSFKPNDLPHENRNPSDMAFGLRGPNEGQYQGPGDRFFSPQRQNDPLNNQRGPNDNTFNPRGLNDSPFTPRGGQDGSFAPRGFNDRQFDSQGSKDVPSGPPGINDRYFGQRVPPSGPNDSLFMSRNHSEQFNVRPPFGPRGTGDFRARDPFDNVGRDSTPRSDGGNGNWPERNLETGSLDIRNDAEYNFKRSGTFEDNEKMQVDRNMDQGPGWRQTFSHNSFGDTDQRSVRDVSQKDIHNVNATASMDQRPPFVNKLNTMSDNGRPERLGESIASDFPKFGGPSNAFIKSSLDSRPPQSRASNEFCIQKQFNYNHGESTTEMKYVEHVPVKIIDYAHVSRPTVQDHLNLVQCFDYGHGNLKPVLPDGEIHPKKDFRNWEENEQNLKDYTERIETYEYYAGREDVRRPRDFRQRRDSDTLVGDRRSERERRDRDDYKRKDRGEERRNDRKSDKDQDNRYSHDRHSNKERAQERSESTQKEVKKEIEKVEDRSKGNINWQESSNKNIIETKPQDSSVPEPPQNAEPPPKTLDLAKTPNCTMVDDLLCPPGRQNRPPKIAIILRGPPGSGKSFVAKLIKDKEVEQGGSAPRILSLDDYFLVEKEVESKDDNGKKVTIKEMVYEYEEAMEQSYVTSLIKAFKKNITDGFFNFIILDCINEKISDYEEMWSFAKTKGFKVYVCEMEMDLQICLKRNIHNRTEDEINRIIDYFEPTPSYHQKLDVNSMLQDQAIEEVQMEDSEQTQEETPQVNEDSQDSQEDLSDSAGVSKWERMEAEDKLDRLDGLAKKKNEGKVQTMQDFLQVPDYYNMEDTSGKKRVRWADLEERKEQEKMRAVGFVVGHTNWDRMMDPTKGGSALTRTKYI